LKEMQAISKLAWAEINTITGLSILNRSWVASSTDKGAACLTCEKRHKLVGEI
jgi:hypothetical protein